jgi:hypothetical protein
LYVISIIFASDHTGGCSLLLVCFCETVCFNNPLWLNAHCATHHLARPPPARSPLPSSPFPPMCAHLIRPLLWVANFYLLCMLVCVCFWWNSNSRKSGTLEPRIWLIFSTNFTINWLKCFTNSHKGGTWWPYPQFIFSALRQLDQWLA